ncbi:unnamed protein product [Orchesella dallaii]|uniref:Uncharacterized protein n=1 Tax=Orchesella dallaii TaxID=48710 RepID=A0ABP1S131_9HEXA
MCLKLLKTVGRCTLLKSCNLCNHRPTVKEYKLLSLLFCAICFCVTAFIGITEPIFDIRGGFVRKIYVYSNRIKGLFYQQFLPSANFTVNVNDQISLGDLHGSDLILWLLASLILPASGLATAFRVVALLHPSITLFHGVTVFMEKATSLLELEQDIKSKKKIILDEYLELRNLSKVYNEVWGSLTLISVLDFIVWLSTDLDVGLKAKFWIARLSAIWFFFAVFIPLLLCGEISRRMTNFKILVLRKRRVIFPDIEEFHRFTRIIDNEKVGIGMIGVYYTDYSYSGQGA